MKLFLTGPMVASSADTANEGSIPSLPLRNPGQGGGYVEHPRLYSRRPQKPSPRPQVFSLHCGPGYYKNGNMMNIITNSMMQTGKTCMRKLQLAYELRFRRIRDAAPLRIGAAIHYGLDLYKKNIMEGKKNPAEGVIDAVMLKYNEYEPDEQHRREWEVERVTIAAMLSGYFWRWGERDKEIKYLETESKFEQPIVNPATGKKSRLANVAGVKDGIVDCDGVLMLLEHKTTSYDIDPESDYWKRLRIDSQVSLYVLAARQSGCDIETILYDVLRKPTIKPKRIPVLDAEGMKQVYNNETGERELNKNGSFKQSIADKDTQYLLTRDETPDEYGKRITEDMGERPDFYFARREIPRLDDDLAEYQYELWQMNHIIHDCRKHNRYPRNTQACIGFGRCDYFDVCTGGYDINSGVVPDGFIRVDNIHSELEEGD